METITSFFISYLAGKSIDYMLKLIEGKNKEKEEFISEAKKQNFSEVQIDFVFQKITDMKPTTIRFNSVVNLLTKDCDLSLSKISELLNFNAPDDIYDYIYGEKNIGFNLINKMENLFNVNEEFLLGKNKYPFKVEKNFYSIREALNKAIEIKAKEIYFLLSKDEDSHYSVVIKENEFKYIILRSYWKLKVSEPPYTERRELENLYETYKVLLDLNNKTVSMKFEGRYLSPEDFNSILNGNVYPRAIFDKTHMSYWVDDFIDIGHNRIKQYEGCYGSEFIKAQKEVKSFTE